LDKKLAMDEHLSPVIKEGTRACLSLQAIKGTRPAQMRQLFRSCVLPITDYAASAWYGPGKVGVVKLVNALEKVQRLGARLITRAWKKVALPILEAEACLEPTKERLERKVSAHVTKLISLPKSNPAKRALLRGFNVITQVSPLGAIVAVSKERLRPNRSRLPIGNPPWIHAPWMDHSYRVVIKEKVQAIRDTATITGADIVGLYTDASVAKRQAAIAVVQRTGIVTQVVRRDSIGWASTCGVSSAEIAAIAAALKYAQEHLKQVQQLVVFSDSQQALRAIQAGNDARTGRALLSKIAESIETLCRACSSAHGGRISSSKGHRHRSVREWLRRVYWRVYRRMYWRVFSRVFTRVLTEAYSVS
jgi:ribonuclease HI